MKYEHTHTTSTSKAAAEISYVSDPLNGLAAIEAVTLEDVRAFCLGHIHSAPLPCLSNEDLSRLLRFEFSKKAIRSSHAAWDCAARDKVPGEAAQARNLSYAITDAADKAFSVKRVRRALKAARLEGSIAMIKSYSVNASVWAVTAEDTEPEPEENTRLLMVMSALKARSAGTLFDAEDVNSILRAFGAGEHQI